MKADLAIHQPHFLPWLPYIARVARVKHFVALDNVTFRKNYYQNRTRLRTSNGSDIWVTLPVQNSSRRLICDTYLGNNASHVIKKIYRTVEQNYSKAPFAEQYLDQCLDFLTQLTLSTDYSLSQIAIESIKFSMRLLNIEQPKILRCSSFKGVPSSRSERITFLAEEVGASTMLNGWGASGNEAVHDISNIEKSGLTMLFSEKFEFSNSSVWRDICGGKSVIHTVLYHGSDVVNELICATKL